MAAQGRKNVHGKAGVRFKAGYTKSKHHGCPQLLKIAVVEAKRYIARELLPIAVLVELLKTQHLLRSTLILRNVSDIIPLEKVRVHLHKQCLVLLLRHQIASEHRIVRRVVDSLHVLLRASQNAVKMHAGLLHHTP